MVEQRDLSRLKGSERVRLRPSVILGSDGIRGVQQTLFEVISNSIDRWKVGYGEIVKIIRHKDNSFTIIDEADGLPCEWNEKESAYNWDLALKTLYGGDNYEQTDDITGKLGNFGLGLTSTMYSSEYMNVTVYKGKYKYTLKFKKGRPIDKNTEEFVCEDDDFTLSKEVGERVLLIEKNTENLSGTTIYYKPDNAVFTEIKVPSDWIKNKIKKQAVVNNGLILEFIDELENDKISYQYKDLSEYVKEIGEDSGISDTILFNNNSEGKDISTQDSYKVDYTVALQFNNKTNIQEYYHNSSELTELKDNVTTMAIKNSLTNVIHDYINKNKLYNKNESKIKFNDIEDSLICVLSSRSNKTSYANQTKLSIDNPFIKEFITNDIKDKLTIYFIENSLEAKKIVEQILINKRANDKAERTKLDIKAKLSNNNKKGLPPKIEGLKDCDMRKSKLEERIFLVNEGKSANSTIISSFDNRIMGAMGLRGRFISSLKASVEDVFKNEPALGLIRALGCGVEIPKEEKKKFKDMKTFDINDLRYNSVGLLCDSDCFGKGINLSLITFFYKFMPTLLKQGRIYLIISPRYELLTKKGETIYVYNEQEKLDTINKLGESNIVSIGVKKGLGEFDKEEFWEYVLSPKAREKTFIQIQYPENEEELVKWYFDTLMGENIAERKEFIKNNITNINLDEIE